MREAIQHPAYDEEKQHLDETVEYIRQKVDDLDQLLSRPTNDPAKIEELRSQRKYRQKLESLISNPYFGRIDMTDPETDQQETYYIGNHGVERNEREIVVVDWRTEFGKIFYRFTGEEELISYQAHGRTIQVKVNLKRRLEIQNAKLLDIQDTVSVKSKTEEDLAFHDPYLYEVLKKQGRTHQLISIVRTIQKEQDEIIRLDNRKPVIIQGSAGSGKSSIAVHRLSYLWYNHKGSLRQEKMLIIVPSRLFLSYLSRLLPELEIEGVRQSTFEDWVISQIGELSVLSPYHKLNQLIDGAVDGHEVVEIAKWKGSLHFQQGIERYLAWLSENCVPEDDLEVRPDLYFSYDEIRQIYKDLYRDYPLNERIQKTLNHVKNLLHEKEVALLKHLEEKFEQEVSRWVNPLPQSERRRETYLRLEMKYQERVQKIRQEFESAWKRYSSKWRTINPVLIYKDLLGDEKKLKGLFPDLSESMRKRVAEQTRQMKNRVEYEDLAPLLHIHYLVNGRGQPYKHITIDEAQDVSPYQMSLLRSMSSNQSMTILGDLAQGIFAYGIQSWEELKKVFAEDPLSIHQLSISYRSTKEIVECSNRVIVRLKNVTIPVPVHVGREGNPPSLVRVEPPELLPYRILKEIRSYQEKGYTSIAIIGKGVKETEELYRFLTSGSKLTAQLVDQSDRTIQEDVVFIPSFLSKGLEFDVVIIPEAGEDRYGEDELDGKLLYVALTRALNELTIFFTGTVTPYLKEMPFRIEKVKLKQKPVTDHGTTSQQIFPKDGLIWFQLSKWGKENALLTPWERKFAYDLGIKIQRGYSLTEKQEQQAQRIWHKALDAGFEPGDRDHGITL